MKLVKILAVTAIASTILSASAAQAEKVGAWTGFDLSPNSWYAYVGAVGAISGQDIASQDGWLLRGSAGYGQYDYDTTAVPGGNVDGDVTSGSLMIGYAHFFDHGNAKAYLGGDVNNHGTDPNDPFSKTKGTEGGVKGQLELALNPAENVNLGAMGSYSSSFDTYWSRFDASYNFGGFAVGPEVLFLGDESFNQARFGAAVSDIDLGPANLRVYAGYAASSGRADDGAYGGIGLGAGF